MLSGSQHSMAFRAPVTVADVDIRSELLSRPQRPPNYQAEERALAALARQMSENPRHMLQTLAEAALDLCSADTAGVSLLEGDVYRWEALAGVLAAKRNGTMSRDASPCGVCIEQDTTQLMHLPDRRFPALLNEPRFVEALLVPFHVQGRAIGTVWVVAHTFDRHFDQEDQRLITGLARYVSAGWQLLLQFLGHEVRAVHDGIAALDEAGRTLPDVVLIDIGLPKLNGYEVAGRMRLVPGMHRAVLVALTGYGTTEDMERAFVAGFQHHLTKPVDLERVEALLLKMGTSSPAALVANA